MKTFYGFLAGINFLLMVECAASGYAWLALAGAGLMALNLWISSKVDQ
jgi:hypothetical protein